MRAAHPLDSYYVFPGGNMRSAALRLLAIILILGNCSCFANAQSAREPLTDSELMALVAGNALSENIVHEIALRGLAFRPGDQYRSQLAAAGGDAAVLAALKSGRIGDSVNHTEKDDVSPFVKHLASAGKLLRSKDYQ